MILLLWLLLSTIVGCVIGVPKGNGGTGAVFGFFLGPIGWIITAVLSDKKRSRKCPACAENIMPEAVVCRFCGHRFAGQVAEQYFDVSHAGEVVPQLSAQDVLINLGAGRFTAEDYYLDPRTNEWRPLELFENAGAVLKG